MRPVALAAAFDTDVGPRDVAATRARVVGFYPTKWRLTVQPAEKISITLPPDMVRLIRDKVASGAYASTSEVIRDAMRVWQRHEEEHAERIAAIRARLQRSMDDPRPDIPAEEVRAWIDELKAAAKKNGGR